MEQTTWDRHLEAEQLLLRYLKKIFTKSPSVARFAKELEQQSSTRLFDWLDHLIVGDEGVHQGELEELGFVEYAAAEQERAFCHPGAQLPSLLLHDGEKGVLGLAVRVESIADFLSIRGRSVPFEGSLLSPYRRALFLEEEGMAFWLAERWGSRALLPIEEEPGMVQSALWAIESWKSRPRPLLSEDEGIGEAIHLAQQMVAEVGQDRAAAIVLYGERHYWQMRNRAAEIQKARQDRLGLGWANHDHHTFRSSREHFAELVRLFEILGFHCRERFYAGEEAGWGAQVMENEEARGILFLDVDLSPEEVRVDFAHEELEARRELGTVGLWCGLHGDSIGKAGMHHLEGQFLFDQLEKDLAEEGVGMMQPFSNFSYLRQAFTEGEMWQVHPKRVERLLQRKSITKEQAETFLQEGALGSHLENLQRQEGYKGFNQKNVSDIIQRTDPRKHA